MPIQPLSSSPATLPLNQEPIREGRSKTAWKTHSLVVLSYFLIGVGLALACASVYLATIIHPVLAMATPIVPIALGILLMPHQSKGLFSTASAPVFLSGQPLGIINPGVNCWLNSALQMLCNASSLKELMGDLSNGSSKAIVPSSEQKLSPFQSLYQLISAFRNYQAEAEEGERPTSSLSSAAIRKWLSNIKTEIPAEGTQEDPMAFFEEVHDRSGHFLPLMQRKNEEEELSRKDCFIPLMMLKDGKNSFTKLFNDYFSEYVADSHNQITRWFSTAPKGFLVQAKRFTWNAEGTRVKIRDSMDFPMTLQLKKEQCKEGSRTFSPDAFIIHHGASANSGHYTAYIRRSGYWWHISDSHVTQVNNLEAQNAIKSAYIVHYAQAAAQAS